MAVRTSWRASVLSVIAALLVCNGSTSAQQWFGELTFDYRPHIDPDFAIIYHDVRDYSDSDTNDIREPELDHLAAKKSKFVCPFHFGDFPDPEDCSSYYKCLFKKPQKKKCPKGKRFDKNSKECTNEDKAVCAGKDDNDEHRDIDFKCPHKYGAYAHPKDCSKFYLCLFGKPALKYCEQSMLFNDKKRECQDKELVDCGSRFNPYDVTTEVIVTTPKTIRTKPPGSSTTEEDSQHTNSTFIVTTETSPGLEETSTITQSSNSTTEDSETSTREVIDDMSSSPSPPISSSTVNEQSSSNTPSTNQITQDRSTSSETQTESATAAESTTKFEETPSTNDVTTITPDQETTEFLSTTDSPLNFVCPKKTGMFSFQNDCSKYYLCRNSTAKVKECEEDTLFHGEYGFCYNAEDVDCGQRKRPEKYSTSTIAQTDHTSSNEQTDTTEAVMTENTDNVKSTPTIESEVTDGPTTESSIASSSNTAAETEPETTTTTTTQGNDDVATDEPQTSPRTDGMTTESVEPEGLTTPTTESTLSTATNSVVRTTMASSTSDVVTNTEDIQYCDEKDETCVADDQSGLILRCPKTDGLFPHPTDATKFLQCVHTKIYIHQCPKDLVFNPKLQVCSWS